MARNDRAALYVVILEPEVLRTDAIRPFVRQETPILRLADSSGEVGVGYCYTIGQGGGAVMSLLQQTMLPCLIGQGAENIERICHDLLYRTHATAIGAVTIVRDDLRRHGALGSALQVCRLAAALAEWRGLCSE